MLKIRIKVAFLMLPVFVLAFVAGALLLSSSARAQYPPPPSYIPGSGGQEFWMCPCQGGCAIGICCLCWEAGCSACSYSCEEHSTNETNKSIDHVTKEFMRHWKWFAEVYWMHYWLPAMQLMTEQLHTVMISQVQAIGMFLDAKHQLETQRLFQQLVAEAHKDYHPSEGICVAGSVVRSLAASERTTDLAHIAISNRNMQRLLLSNGMSSEEGYKSDIESRMRQFINVYCDPRDEHGGLKNLCRDAGGQPARVNRDVDYARMVDMPLTLDIDLSDNRTSDDEEDLFALSANLFGHMVPKRVKPGKLVKRGVPDIDGVEALMDNRAIVAKRSVAQNSFAAVAAMKARGSDDATPFMNAILKEMFPDGDSGYEEILGERPSYYAQMEVLTKKMYQNPAYYADLYDKPVNVLRRDVALQAVELMQKRDIYRSLLRSEMVFSVMLETALMPIQDKLKNEIDTLEQEGGLVPR